MNANSTETIETSATLDTMTENHPETIETSATLDTNALAIALKVLSLGTQNDTMQQI
jgi:hypothetical protein